MLFLHAFKNAFETNSHYYNEALATFALSAV